MYYQALRKWKKCRLIKPSQHTVTDGIVAWDLEILWFASTHSTLSPLEHMEVEVELLPYFGNCSETNGKSR